MVCLCSQRRDLALAPALITDDETSDRGGRLRRKAVPNTDAGAEGLVEPRVHGVDVQVFCDQIRTDRNTSLGAVVLFGRLLDRCAGVAADLDHRDARGEAGELVELTHVFTTISDLRDLAGTCGYIVEQQLGLRRR